MGKTGDSGKQKKKDSSATNKPLKKQSGARKISGARGAEGGASGKDEDAGGDDGDAKAKPKKKSSARAQAAPPKANTQAEQFKKAFLYSTPIVMILLLVIGWKLATMEDPKPKEIILDYTKDIAAAQAKYVQAQGLYKQGHDLEGDAGGAKLREAKNLLGEATAMIDKVREECDKDPKAEKDAQGHIMNYPFEDLAQKVSMLMVDCNKELRAK